MSKQIITILLILGLCFLASCKNEDNLVILNETGDIRFSLVDTTEVGITTRASLNLDVNEFWVSLNRDDTTIFSRRKYSEIYGNTISCSAAPGYVLTAENCNESEAESANLGWGQPRVRGEETFTVIANETTNVTVICGLVNSSVNVDFSDSIEDLFSEYSIEIHATDATDRTFTFDQSNNQYKIAYFNVDESGRKLAYTVTLPSPYKTYTGTIDMESSKNYTLSVKVEDDDSNSNVKLGLIVDGTLLKEEVLTEKINPYI